MKQSCTTHKNILLEKGECATNISKQDDSCMSLSHLGQRTHIISYTYTTPHESCTRKKTSLLSYCKKFFFCSQTGTQAKTYKKKKFPHYKLMCECIQNKLYLIYKINGKRKRKKTFESAVERNARKCIESLEMRSHSGILF